MKPEADLARLRATYADLLSPEGDAERVSFLGDLEALHTAPRLPAAMRTATSRPREREARGWQGQETRPLSPLTWPRHDNQSLPVQGQAQQGRWSGVAHAANIAATIVLIVGVI